MPAKQTCTEGEVLDHTQVYETEAIISDIGAEAFYGRGTRVWRVRKVVDGQKVGPPRVLKDCWINADRLREGTTLRNIIQQLPMQHPARRHFLTIEVDADVIVNGHPDCTDTMHHGLVCPEDLPELLVADILSGLVKPGEVVFLTPENYISSRSGSGGIPFIFPLYQPFKPKTYQSRQHYRIVFEEEGIAVKDLGNRHDMILAIQGGCTGELMADSHL